MTTTGEPWSEVLGDLEMTGVFYSTGRFAEPWGIDMPALPGTLMFHLLLQGSAVVEVDDQRHRLAPGDLLLVPHGTGHRILSAPGAPARGLWDVERTVSGERYEHLVIPGDGTVATLACGAVSFTDPGVGRLLASLPPALPAARSDDVGGGEAGDGVGDAWVRAAIDAIGREARHPRPGSDVVSARLADVVLVHAVRQWLDAERPASGWVAALRDPALGPALRAVHADPGEPWTLEVLARRAQLSRSAFAERFTAVVGEPPMAYVTAWRLDLAARLLRAPGASVAAVARRVGYESGPGFHRAFVRRHGVTPGVWQRDGAPDPVARALAATETIAG
jgi:AraC-like DNA-binding protein